MQEKFDQREGASEKEKRWLEIEAEVGQIIDPLGKGIDTDIKSTVIGLMANGFKTAMSCEGHLDHGLPWPRVRLGSLAEEELDKKPRYLELEARVDESMADSHEEEEYYELRQSIFDASSREAAKLTAILDIFYSSADANRPEGIVVDNFGIVEPLAIRELSKNIKGEILEIHRDWPMEEKREKLQLYQNEFKRFAEFLKENFFSGK